MGCCIRKTSLSVQKTDISAPGGHTAHQSEAKDRMEMSSEEYGRRVRRAGPPSRLGRDCLWAFGVGGGICTAGEALRQALLGAGAGAVPAGTLTNRAPLAPSAGVPAL